MKDKFLPLELTQRMFKIGYQQQTTFAWWNYIKTNPELSLDIDLTIDQYSDDYESAILWQDAFDWFRIEHNMIGEISYISTDDSNDDHFGYTIYMDISEEYIIADVTTNYNEVRIDCITEMIKILEDRSMGTNTQADENIQEN